MATTDDSAATAHLQATTTRRVCLAMRVTLDGYVSGPDGELDWMFSTSGRDTLEHATGFLRDVDTILLGRTAYLEQAAHWPKQTSEMADLLNTHTKIVFSSTLRGVEWNNSRLATGDVATEIARLKQQSGKNIYVSGGAALAQTVSRLGLVDEYHLTIHPVALGAGLPLFKALAQPRNLKLLSTRAFAGGAVQLAYGSA
jgi:dihydrofolate reductase